jgi:PAS domain S-box-containing protein
LFVNLRRKYIRLISKKFDDFIEQDISSICITRIDGTIFQVNSNFDLLFNYKKGEIIGGNLRDVISENCKGLFENLINRSGNSVNDKVVGKGEIELEGIKKSGEFIPIMMRLSKISLLGENYIYVTINDLTELKQKEKQIVSISRFPEENPHFVLRVDKTGQILYANHSSKTFFKELNYSSKCEVVSYLRGKVDYISKDIKPTYEELKIDNDSYYVSLIPILDKHYFNIYVTKITDYVSKVEEREQKLKTLSEELSERVESQVGEIREKNQSLVENIRFAKTIQDSFESKAIQVIRKKYEVQYLNNPHSIVSGDFIWSSDAEDGRTFILFGDCTGHGVSASMIAVMVNSLLTQRLITEKSLSGIMDALRDDIIKLTSQELKYGVNVGLDAALLAIDKNKRELEFCGANISVHIERNKKLKEFRGNRFGLSLEGSI